MYAIEITSRTHQALKLQMIIWLISIYSIALNTVLGLANNLYLAFKNDCLHLKYWHKYNFLVQELSLSRPNSYSVKPQIFVTEENIKTYWELHWAYIYLQE